MLASFPFSNGLGTSLPLSRVKNSVIGYCSAALSKNRVWTRSLVKLEPNYKAYRHVVHQSDSLASQTLSFSQHRSLSVSARAGEEG